jgi:hypothetical protein
MTRTTTPWRITKDCHFCGINQTTDTAFSGLFRHSDEALVAMKDFGNEVNDITAYFEINVCLGCVNDLFDGSIGKAIDECSETSNKALTA